MLTKLIWSWEVLLVAFLIVGSLCGSSPNNSSEELHSEEPSSDGDTDFGSLENDEFFKKSEQEAKRNSIFAKEETNSSHPKNHPQPAPANTPAPVPMIKPKLPIMEPKQPKEVAPDSDAHSKDNDNDVHVHPEPHQQPNKAPHKIHHKTHEDDTIPILPPATISSTDEDVINNVPTTNEPSEVSEEASTEVIGSYPVRDAAASTNSATKFGEGLGWMFILAFGMILS